MTVRESTCLEFAAHTKITDFDMPIISDQQIFWFDVSMDNVLCATTYSLNQLLSKSSYQLQKSCNLITPSIS